MSEARRSREIRELREQNRRLIEALMRSPSQFLQSTIDLARQAELDRQEREHVRTLPFREQQRYWAGRRLEEARRRAELLLQFQALRQSGHE